MPDTGGPNTVGDDDSKGEVRCDEDGLVVIKDVEKSQSSDINKAIESHFRETGHGSYSFYGRTKMET